MGNPSWYRVGLQYKHFLNQVRGPPMSDARNSWDAPDNVVVFKNCGLDPRTPILKVVCSVLRIKLMRENPAICLLLNASNRPHKSHSINFRLVLSYVKRNGRRTILHDDTISQIDPASVVEKHLIGWHIAKFIFNVRDVSLKIGWD